ncbi:cysteine hydrolase family protein [Thermomonospora cellulosilytica]|uniref:Nicotinamidase-related amidase n=1 Tax=Thermomonospora cellulosilytica TaxID=1411118 RepID=A0A7W3MXX8_9ACTN|nr:isochorismatase family cysteine hydrolase [Thermomonospora cellulosilytica]MBA9003954.1 nicotinamidase-related amidase [Thermomonospora cellulosilytica]
MSTSALIVIDMLNPYDHEDADVLAGSVEKIVAPLRSLVERARDRDDVLLLYVNDNYGDFSATRDQMIDKALRGRRPDLVEPIVPADDCAFLAKVRHSAFYGTALEYLLLREGVEEVVLSGQVTEQCILYSALDAYVRHLRIRVPRDTVAHIDPGLGEAALRMMERNMRADIVTAATCFG